jgi:hypothetical protein
MGNNFLTSNILAKKDARQNKKRRMQNRSAQDLNTQPSM